MGIRFLHTFLQNNPENFKTVRLHRIPIIVDGHNAAYNLYNEALILKQFNGEYLQFAAVVELFLLNLKKCELEPVFVFDGLHAPERFDACIRRLRKTHWMLTAFQESAAADHLPVEKSEIPNLCCPLVISTLVTVLRRLNIAYFFTDFEVERLIAGLAIKLGCPVMSRDSDFFIFSNYWGETCGYCAIQPLPFNVQPKLFEDNLCADCAQKEISRQLYKQSQKRNKNYCYYLEATSFAPEQGAFSRLAAPLRPVFAVLWGNDYVPLRYFDPYLPSTVTDAVNADGCFDILQKMENLISWLSSFGSSLQEPINYVLSRVPPAKRAEAEETFFTALSLYCIDCKRDLERYGKFTGFAASKFLTDASATPSSKNSANSTAAEYAKRARQILLGGQGETVIPDLTEKWPKALREYFRTQPTFRLFNAVYSFPHLCGFGIQDMRLAERADFCAQGLRQLIYSVIFHLEKGDRRNLHGVKGPTARAQVAEIKINTEGQPEWTAVQLLPLQITTPLRLLKVHFGLPASSSPDLPGALHGLACACFIVLQAANQEGKEPQTTAASSPMILATLAFAVAAFALQETLQQKSLSQEHLERMDCQESVSGETNLNFACIHIYAQLQVTYCTLITLVAVLTSTMASREPVDFGSNDEATLCFPSGRLAYRLAVRLSLLPQNERQKELCEVIFPRLLKGGDLSKTAKPPPRLTENALHQVTAKYARIVAFVDKLLEDRR